MVLILLPVVVALPTSTGINVQNLAAQPLTSTPPSVVANVSTNEATTDGFQLKTWTAEGLHWVFYYDGTTNIECATSSNGIDWTQGISIVSNPNINSGETFSTWYNSTTNIFYLVYSNNNAVAYRYGNLSPSGCSSINWLIPFRNQLLHDSLARYPSIAATSPSNVWISVSTNVTNVQFQNDHIEVWKGNATSGGLLNVKDIHNFASHPHSMILPLSGNKWSLVYGDDNTNPANYLNVTIYSGSGWTKPVQSPKPSVAPFDAAAALGGNTYVVYRAASGATSNYSVFSISSTGKLTSNYFLSGLGSPAIGSSISVNQTTGEIAVMYADNIAIRYFESTNGGTSFGTMQTICGSPSTVSCNPQIFTLSASYYATALDYTDLVWTNLSGQSYQLEYSGIGTSQLPTFTTTTTTSVTSNATVTSTNTIPTTITSGTCTDPEVTTTLTSTLTNTIVVTQTVVSSTTICGTTVSSSSNVSTSSTTASSSTSEPQGPPPSTTTSSTAPITNIPLYLEIGAIILLVLVSVVGYLFLSRRRA